MADYSEPYEFSPVPSALYVPSSCAPLSGSHYPNLGSGPAPFPGRPHLFLSHFASNCLLNGSVSLFFPAHSPLLAALPFLAAVLLQGTGALACAIGTRPRVRLSAAFYRVFIHFTLKSLLALSPATLSTPPPPLDSRLIRYCVRAPSVPDDTYMSPTPARRL